MPFSPANRICFTAIKPQWTQKPTIFVINMDVQFGVPLFSLISCSCVKWSVLPSLPPSFPSVSPAAAFVKLDLGMAHTLLEDRSWAHQHIAPLPSSASEPLCPQTGCVGLCLQTLVSSSPHFWNYPVSSAAWALPHPQLLTSGLPCVCCLLNNSVQQTHVLSSFP